MEHAFAVKTTTGCRLLVTCRLVSRSCIKPCHPPMNIHHPPTYGTQHNCSPRSSLISVCARLCILLLYMQSLHRHILPPCQAMPVVGASVSALILSAAVLYPVSQHAWLPTNIAGGCMQHTRIHPTRLCKVWPSNSRPPWKLCMHRALRTHQRLPQTRRHSNLATNFAIYFL